MRDAISFEGKPEKKPEFFSLDETNAIQLELMKEDGGDPVHWIETYSEPFRLIIDREPQLHAWYVRDPQACIGYIKHTLKERTQFIEACSLEAWYFSTYALERELVRLSK